MATMTWNEADRLLSYGNHTNECSVFNGQREPICNCGFGELRTEALDLFALTTAPEQADADGVTEADVWGTPEDAIAMYRQQLRECRANRDRVCVELRGVNATLRADLSTVRAERDAREKAWKTAATQRDELLVENAEHKAYTDSLKSDLKAERKHADGLADALRHKDAEWSPARMSPDRSICPYCLQLKTDGHADNCQRQMLLATHDAWRAGDGGDE